MNSSDLLDLRVARGKTKNKRQTEVFQHIYNRAVNEQQKPFHEMLWQAIDSDKQGDGECHPHPKSLNSD
ncbi:hypothetical protein B5D77_14510 [Microcystis sp. MC19]|nr:hypothetical protein B5D77_14510 [Microcystis sp. MC19]